MSLNEKSLSDQIEKHCDHILNNLIPSSPMVKDNISQFYKKDLLPFILTLNELNGSQKDEQKRFDTLIDNIVKKGHLLENTIKNTKITIKIKQDFRELVGQWVYQSKIAKRAYEKPRGYPGDYLLLETIYDKAPITDKKDKIGYYGDKYFQNDPLAHGVRARKDKMAELLAEYFKNNKKSISITNFASGSAREIKDALKCLDASKTVNINCVDFDEEALAFTKSFLINSGKLSFNFIKADIIKLSLKKITCEALNQQDYVYSIGLIDYLPNGILKNFIEYSYSILKPGGQLILSHKDQDQYVPLVQDWFCDWSFYERSWDAVHNIIKEANVPSNKIKYIPLDTVKSLYYIIIDK